MAREQRDPTNPFDLVNAKDYSDKDILSHFVDLGAKDGGLLNIIQPRLMMPMLLVGGKGSGKTHLMRLCSCAVQAQRFGGNLRKAVENEGYLGVYVRAEGLNLGKFTSKTKDSDFWNDLFCAYLEIWLVADLVLSLISLKTESSNDIDENRFVSSVLGLFDIDLSHKVVSLETFYAYLDLTRKQIDFNINNSSFSKSIEIPSIAFSRGKLLFDIPKIISETIPYMQSCIIVYLIDEAENFDETQQRFVNTLIRYRRNNATIKVSARLYGFKTKATYGGSGEPIKMGSEYEQIELDTFVRAHSGAYKDFALQLIRERLQWARLPIPAGGNFDTSFEQLDGRNHFSLITQEIVKTWDKSGSARPYFQKLETELLKAGVKESTVVDLMNALKIDRFPLLEKVNILLLYRAWTGDEETLRQVVRQIREQAHNFLDRPTSAKGYGEVVKHFGLDLLAQLYRDCQRRVPYAGLDVLIDLSQGIPRNLLILLRHIYRRSMFAGERPFCGGLISIDSQSEGVSDSASWFWEDAQPDGPEVRQPIEMLAYLFRAVRYSFRPSECKLCTFSVDKQSLSKAAQEVLVAAENWSYLIRLRDTVSDRNSHRPKTKYQLAPMLVPKWGLSPHRRGNMEIHAIMGSAIFDPSQSDEAVAMIEKRVQEMYLITPKSRDPKQKQLEL